MTQTVTPYLLYEDGEAAIHFLVQAFGFREVERTVGSAGGLHAELETPLGGRIYLGQPGAGFRNPAEADSTSQVYVLVEDADAHCERARAAGATITDEPQDLPFAHRRYECVDPQGHVWSFAHVVDG